MSFGSACRKRSIDEDRRDGFSLIELLIVIVVLGIIAAVVIFSLGGVSNKAAVTACKSNAKTVAIAVQAYKSQHNGTPTQDDLIAPPEHYLQTWPSSPYYGIKILSDGNVGVFDPVTDPSGANAKVWTVVGACDVADANLGGSPSGTTTPTTAPITTPHTVTFDRNSFSAAGSMADETHSTPTALTTNTFTRSGYTFAGWNTSPFGNGTDYADGAIYSFSDDITLYAQWTALPNHTVTFNGNGGTGSMAAADGQRARRP